MKRLLITGTRLGWDPASLSFHLGLALGELTSSGHKVVLVHGDADGVDRQAAKIFAEYDLPCESHPADWDTYGRSAGPRRNSEMVALGADMCLAFIHPDSRGTIDCANKAIEAGILTRRIYRAARD